MVIALVVVSGLIAGGFGAWRLFTALLPVSLPPGPECDARAGGKVTLTPEQMGNAATIAAIGVRRGLPVRAVQVALVTALQESKLVNLSGGDRDSVGLFQQRPSQGWGRADQLTDAHFAITTFYTALTKVPAWKDLSVPEAAQQVQHSGYPDAYVQWVDRADILARALATQPDGAVSCTGLGTPQRHGAAAADAVIAGLRADWGQTASTPRPGTMEMAVPAADPVAAWRYASWLVAHAAEDGVDQVQVAGMSWTSKGGRWNGPTTAPGPVTVTFRVHPDP